MTSGMAWLSILEYYAYRVWEDNMKRPFMTIACIAALCGPASATDFKFDQVSCYSGPAHLIQHADGIIAGSYEGTGMLRGNEGTPFLSLIHI